MGPTASGKTDLALKLVQELPCDIISVDSALVYRGMDIGTAKPNAEILKKVPHRLIDIRDPSEPYSAGNFREDALREIQAIHAKNRIPLLVGGTGLYFRALQQGLSKLPKADPEIREKLNAEAEKVGWQTLHQRLMTIDPITAQRIHPNDSQRIQRALEVYEISGFNLSHWYQKTIEKKPFCPIIKLILSPAQRSVLHAKIAQRAENMLTQGLIEEVRHLFTRDDLHADLPALRAVGYRQTWRYLASEFDEKELLEQIIIATRQLAKRQLVWLRAEKDAQWFDSQQQNMAQYLLKYLIKNIAFIQEMKKSDL